jgi:hypothetical protein
MQLHCCKAYFDISESGLNTGHGVYSIPKCTADSSSLTHSHPLIPPSLPSHSLTSPPSLIHSLTSLFPPFPHSHPHSPSPHSLPHSSLIPPSLPPPSPTHSSLPHPSHSFTHSHPHSLTPPSLSPSPTPSLTYLMVECQIFTQSSLVSGSPERQAE